MATLKLATRQLLMGVTTSQENSQSSRPRRGPRLGQTLCWHALGLGLLAGLLAPAHSQVAQSPQLNPAQAASPAKKPRGRLARQYEVIGVVDDHPCTREMKFRQEDYLAQLNQQDRKELLDRAGKGDADAMYTLAQIPVEVGDSAREFPYRSTWLARAAQAGHPIAQHDLAEQAYERGQLPAEQFLPIIEAAARWQPTGDIAWRLAYSYANTGIGDIAFKVPRNYPFLEIDKHKAFDWARLAAGKGNLMAAEDLCTTTVYGTTKDAYGVESVKPEDGVRWCTFAAQALCADGAPLMLALIFEQGLGVPRSSIDALVWRRIAAERLKRNHLRNWEYLGAPSDE